MKGICIYVDGGKGHYVPAKAVETELIERGIETRFEEFFDYLDIRWMGRINKFFWRMMLRMPSIEQKVSKHNDAGSNGMGMAIKFAKNHLERVLRTNLEEFKPDFFFATHPYASTIISEMLADMDIDIPVFYFATDVFNAPVASICDKIKRFYISTEEGAEIVRNMGLPENLIKLSPFPLQQVLKNSPKLSKREAREKLELRTDLFTMQLNLGGEGLGSISLVESLFKVGLSMQVVVIGGIDKKMAVRLERLRERCRADNFEVVIRGFVENVNEYLAASDVVVGRAGINTVVEAIYAHRPFLITELVYTVIPSADYIEKYHVGWNAEKDMGKQVSIITDLARNPERLAALEDNFEKVPIEYSAGKLADMVLSEIEE